MAGYNAMPGLSSMSPSGAGRGGRAGASSGDGDVAHTIGVPGDMEGFEHEQLKFGIDESLLDPANTAGLAAGLPFSPTGYGFGEPFASPSFEDPFAGYSAAVGRLQPAFQDPASLMDPTAGADPGPHIHHHYAGLGPSLGHHQHYDSHGQGHVHGLMQQPQSQQPPSVLGGFPTAGAHTPVTATFAEQMSGAGTGCEFGSDRIDSVTSGLAQPLPSTVPAAAAEGAAADVVVSAAREATPGSDSDEPGGTDRKLLGFSTPKVYATPLDENGWPAEPLMTAELNGMFFVAEDVFAAVDGGGGTGSISSSGGNSTSGGGGGDDTASSGVSTGTSGPTTIQSQGPRQPGAPLPSRPTELTCYRRNLWQCSGKITLPRQVTHVVMPNGDGVGGGKDGGGHRVRIYELAASIGAVESIEGRPTEIISIPWKTPPPPPPPQRPRSSDHNGDWPPPPPEPPPPGTAIAAPPRITLDLASAAQRQDVVVSPADGRPGSSSSTRTPPTPRVAVPVSWKRLQFKHATANNGRRKGLQQHYVVRITLLGRTTGDDEGRGGAAKGGGTAASSGEWLKIAEISSGPIIVRGRSPRNFNQDRDVPLSADRRQQWERQRRWHSSTTATAAGGSGGVLPGGDAASMTGASAVVDEKQPVVKLENAPQQSRDAHMRLYPSGAAPENEMRAVNTGSLAAASQSPDLASPTAAATMQSPSRRQAATLSPGASNRPPVPGFGSSIDTTDGGLKQKQTSPAPANTTNAASTGATFPIIPSVPIALSLSDLSNEDERQQDAGPAIHRSKQQPAEDTGGPGPADISVGTASMSASPRVPTNVERMHCDARSSSRDAAGSVDVDANMDGDTAVGLELNSAGSPRESGGDVEMLYEYFPLSVDDWMSPVDAIYRPHVVHHTILPPDVKAQQVRSKAKRYFIAD